MESYQLAPLFNFALVVIFVIGFVATVMWFKKKENDNRTKVLLTALEKGAELNPELLAPQKNNRRGAHKWGLLALLIGGIGDSIHAGISTVICILEAVRDSQHLGEMTFNTNEFRASSLFLAIGIASLIGYSVGKKLLKPELEQEEAKK